MLSGLSGRSRGELSTDAVASVASVGGCVIALWGTAIGRVVERLTRFGIRTIVTERSSESCTTRLRIFQS